MDVNLRLIQGDCMDAMQELIDEGVIVDMVLADLPYGVTANAWDSVLPLDKLWELYWQILKPTGVVVLTASQPFTSQLVMSQVKYFRHEWIWIKNRGSNFANTQFAPMKEHESVLVFSKGKWTYNKQMQERTGGGASRVGYKFTHASKSTNYREFEARENVERPDLRIPSSWQKFNIEVGLHPTQKPVALMEYMIKTYTDRGEIVLDNCMGSGSTGVAALELKRKFIGIELDEAYFKIAKERTEEIDNRIDLFE